MKLILPQNLFSELIVNSLKDDLKKRVIYKPASLITQEIKNVKNSIGLIPTLDLLKNDDLFVSRVYGISFEGSLCNSYIYFKPGLEKIDQISLFGDVSSLEVILSKVLFKEIYNTDIKVEILTSEQKIQSKDLIIIGNKNFEQGKFFSGISFSEEVIESLNLPFANYVFASTEKDLIEELNKNLQDVPGLVYENIENYKFSENINAKAVEYIKTNISSFIIEFAPNDIEGINQLLRLPYYYGIINDIIEVKFI